MTINASTANNMMLAAGATVTVALTDIGAMEGETTYSIDVERYFPELHGTLGEVKGTGFIVGAVAKITTTMAETSYFQLSVLMDSLGVGSDVASRWYGSGTLGQMVAGDYQSIVVTGMETCGNKSVVITLPYAYVSSSVNVTLSDDAITTYEVEFTGTYDPADPDRLPSRITIEI